MTHKIRIMAGSEIKSAIDESIALAKSKDAVIEFEFNGVTVQVAGDSDAKLIYRDWDRGMLRSGGFTVSPYPPHELAASDLAEDARLTAERDQRIADARRTYEQEMADKKAAVVPQIESVELALIYPDTWQKFVDGNTDPYGAACVKFAENWGRLMQVKIAAGASLADIADACSSEADTEGITGFMYGAAVSMLAQCWVHGEELRRWHNLQTQIGNEGEKANQTGGTLNPALLRIGG